MSRFLFLCLLLHTGTRMGKPGGIVGPRPEILEEGTGDKYTPYLPKQKLHVPRRVRANLNQPRPRTLAEGHQGEPLLGVHQMLKSSPAPWNSIHLLRPFSSPPSFVSCSQTSSFGISMVSLTFFGPTIASLYIACTVYYSVCILDRSSL